MSPLNLGWGGEKDGNHSGKLKQNIPEKNVTEFLKL